VATLHRAAVDALAGPDIQKALVGLGGVIRGSSPEQLSTHLRDEYAKWGEVIRVSGARMN